MCPANLPEELSQELQLVPPACLQDKVKPHSCSSAINVCSGTSTQTSYICSLSCVIWVCSSLSNFQCILLGVESYKISSLSMSFSKQENSPSQVCICLSVLYCSVLIAVTSTIGLRSVLTPLNALTINPES